MSSTEDERRRAVAEALANLRLSGFEPDADFEALLDQYVRGEISLDEIRLAIRKVFGVQPPRP